jgi:outer membrane protein OmpA-like peptidoglycan-associated protein
MIVSGPEFLFIIGRVLSLTEEPGFTRADRGEQKVEESQRQAEHEALAEEINEHLAGMSDAVAIVTNEGVTISLSNIQFLPNPAILAEPEKEKSREIADVLKTVPGKRIVVTGHTANAGTRPDQLKTSSERAQAVADFLVSCGTRHAGEIAIIGYGAERPIADNSTERGMAANRRVEIIILDY